MLTEAALSPIVLVVENDAQQRQKIVQALLPVHYVLLEANSARETLRLARQQRPHLIILPDHALPDMHGHMLCTQLRTLPFVERAAMLFLGKRPSAEAVAQALDCGGDDYLRQPFEPRELQARVRALTRRTIPKRTTTDVTLHLDSASHSVHIGSRCAQLTPTEFALLSYLCGNPSQLHSASSLLEALWRYSAGDGDTALVRNHIRNLRRKIEENPAHPRIIVSLHGRGYIVRAHAIHWN